MSCHSLLPTFYILCTYPVRVTRPRYEYLGCLFWTLQLQ
jgi:hypothetical protein